VFAGVEKPAWENHMQLLGLYEFDTVAAYEPIIDIKTMNI